MNIENEVFKKFIPNFDKLLRYGFKKKNNNFIFEKMFKDGEFRATVKISSDGTVTGNVFDIENDEEYLPLRLEGRQGAFVGDVRGAYIEILTDIRDKCFLENNFLTPQANSLAQKIYSKYGDKPVFMWEKYPTFGVFKNPDSDKWYFLVMNIERNKLGEKTKGYVEVANLKLDPKEILELVGEKGFYQAYHMNKKYWITIALDGTLTDERILELIEKSHAFTLKKKR